MFNEICINEEMRPKYTYFKLLIFNYFTFIFLNCAKKVEYFKWNSISKFVAIIMKNIWVFRINKKF